MGSAGAFSGAAKKRDGFSGGSSKNGRTSETSMGSVGGFSGAAKKRDGLDDELFSE